jgi:small conductance mechanosensitive channel
MVNIIEILPFAGILVRLIAVVVTFIVGRWLAKQTRIWLKGILKKQGLPESVMTVLVNVTHFGIWLITILTILALLGVPMQALITGVAIVFILVGIALRESLSNFAATIIFALFKPFEAGDLIETVGTLGVVQEIQLFNTELLSFDNKVHILPNGLIQASGLTNLSRKGKIRLDLLFSISYRDDVVKAKKVLQEMLIQDERVQVEPAPIIFVKALSNSSVDIAVWPFVQPKDYLAFQFDVMEKGKFLLEEVGITIPFPQRDIHLYQHVEK